MNILSLYLSTLPFTLLILFVKHFTPLILTLPSLMFSLLFSKTSRRRIRLVFIISLLQIFFKFTTSNKKSFKISPQTLILKNNIKYNHCFFPSQFSKDELLPFIASSENQDPSFLDFHDFTVSHSEMLTYDTHSFNKCLELPPPVRPFYTYLP